MTPQQEALLLEADKWHDPSLGTHWVGCYAEHPRCMIYMLARELRAALADAERLHNALVLARNGIYNARRPEWDECETIDTIDRALNAARAGESSKG